MNLRNSEPNIMTSSQIANSSAKLYRSVFVDQYQSATYRHVATRVETDGRLTAIFADGQESPSSFASESDMLEAGRRDWRERMILVDQVCICGHQIDEHDASGRCSDPDCICDRLDLELDAIQSSSDDARR